MKYGFPAFANVDMRCYNQFAINLQSWGFGGSTKIMATITISAEEETFLEHFK